MKTGKIKIDKQIKIAEKEEKNRKGVDDNL